MKTRHLSLVILAAAGLAACGDSKAHKTADSLAAAKSSEQARLTVQLAAQKDPEKYRDLVVRIAGYSAYFVDLSPSQQSEIIARTGEAA